MNKTTQQYTTKQTNEHVSSAQFLFFSLCCQKPIRSNVKWGIEKFKLNSPIAGVKIFFVHFHYQNTVAYRNHRETFFFSIDHDNEMIYTTTIKETTRLHEGPDKVIPTDNGEFNFCGKLTMTFC